ncbi:MAG TPA: flavodoxin family protein, partial [Methanoregula sp.]|nr:flavodoxin family protein [Methanoregula sp.]
NAARLLNRAREGAEDAGCSVERINLANLCFEDCQEMFFCKDHETCTMDDDMQQLYPKIREADGIIIATPIMCMGIPGKLKSFMDRCQVFYMAKYHRKESLIPVDKQATRRALFICISGMKIPETFVGARLTTKAFCDIIDCRYADELLINDMDTLVDVTRHPELLEASYRKGHALGHGLNP